MATLNLPETCRRPIVRPPDVVACTCGLLLFMKGVFGTGICLFVAFRGVGDPQKGRYKETTCRLTPYSFPRVATESYAHNTSRTKGLSEPTTRVKV